MTNIDSSIISELSKSLLILGANSDLLGIIGSLNDTLDDSEVFILLKQWNDEQTKNLNHILKALKGTDY